MNPAEGAAIDVDGDIAAALARLAPDVVVHTSGPFQTQDHRVARACIAQGCHYLDLADARDFVATIGALDAQARARGVLVVSGASSVPALTAAVVDDALPGFRRLDGIDTGISAAQQTQRGLATTAAVLGYAGRPVPSLRGGQPHALHGWQATRAVRYPELGWRLFGACDVPDLALFPARYPTLQSLRFAAGHEVPLLHAGTWALSWLVRLGLVSSLAPRAAALLRLAGWFDRLGSGRSGFHMRLTGLGHDGRPRERRFFLLAGSGHGPQIPCVPAILLAQRLAAGTERRRGAMPCLDLVTLDDYLAALEGFDIRVVREPAHG